MIDTTRWVLVEAWLALGLRMRWSLSWEARENGREWQEDDGDMARRSFVYAGAREWIVLRPTDPGRIPGYPLPDTPELSASTMAHELAHYLTATAEERGQKNFGIPLDGKDDRGREERAADAEAVIYAMARASGRIATIALQSQRERS